MEYNFKKFDSQHSRVEDRITITKSSYSVGFPTKFYKENGVKDYKYVVLFWDSENKAMGVHFSNNEQEKNKFTVLHSNQGYGGGVSIRSFFKVNEIDPQIYYGKYNWEKQQLPGTGEIFVIKLKPHETSNK